MQMGGAEAVLKRILDALVKDNNFKIVLFTYTNISEPVYADWIKQNKNIKHIVLYPLFGTNLPHFFLFRLFVHAIRDVYRFIKYTAFNRNRFKDIDAVVDFYDCDFLKELKKVNLPKIAWWHSSMTKFKCGNYINKLDYYDKFVVLTDEAKSELDKLLNNKIVNIYNPIDIKDIQNKAKDISKIDLPNKYFCSVARMSQDKDIITILNAFNKFWLDNKKPDVKLILVGGGNLQSYFENIANKLPSKSNIIFTGAQKNPFAYMKYATAHILSSYSEGLPTVLIESMAVETLNIASSCPNGPREILMDGKAGLLFKPGNVDELAQHMTNVYNKNIDINSMVNVATKSLKRFSTAIIIKKITNLF